MEHLSYALFDDETHALAALDELRGDRSRFGRCTVLLHKKTIDEGGVGSLWTGAYRGMAWGVAMGGGFGAIMGGVTFGGLTSVVGGGVVGALYGLVSGVLVGAGAPSRTLEKLSKEVARGKVLLTVRAPDKVCSAAADAALRANGAHVDKRTV